MKNAALLAAASLVACGGGNNSGTTSASVTGGAGGSSSTSGTGTSGSTGGSGSTSGGQFDGGLLTISLTGCPMVSYFAPVTIAGQSFTLLLDTGSTETAVALPACTTCGVTSELSPPPDSCSSQLSTQSELGFMGGVCTETMTVGGESPDVTANMVGIASSGEPFMSADCTQQGYPGAQPLYQGILGLGPNNSLDKIGTAANDAYFSELVANGVPDVFGLLLCSVGGRLWLGGYDPQFASGPPQFTALSMPTGWTISVSSIGLGSTSLGAGDPQSVVDTGTQFYSMPSATYNAFINQSDPGFMTVFGSNTLSGAFGGRISCLAPSGGQSQAQIDAALPPMTLTLPSVGGGSFTLSFAATASYLVPATPADGGAVQYCFDLADSAATGDYSIIGGPMMRGYITLFDEAHGQLGFIPQSFCK